ELVSGYPTDAADLAVLGMSGQSAISNCQRAMATSASCWPASGVATRVSASAETGPKNVVAPAIETAVGAAGAELSKVERNSCGVSNAWSMKSKIGRASCRERVEV